MIGFLGGKLDAGPKTQVDTEDVIQALAAEARQSQDSTCWWTMDDTGLSGLVRTEEKKVDCLKLPILGRDLC